MCGLFGYISKNKCKNIHELNIDGIRNRGPDNIGSYQHEGVALIHSRLSVIDTKETSNQPLQNGDLVLICNGEIYNYKQILSEDKNYHPLSGSDCEAIFFIYRKYGLDGLSKLDGMYSFVLFDKSRERVYFHRDRIGKKPLFYFFDEHTLIFSSNVNAVKDNLKQSDVSICNMQVSFYLENGFVHPSKSIYSEIKPILPGEILEIDLVKFKLKRIAILERNKYENTSGFNEENIIKNIEDLLEGAISKRIAGIDQPVLIYSGGIDSSLLAIEMQKKNNMLALVSLKQFHRKMNDEPYARYLSKKLGKKINWVYPFKNFYSRIESAISSLDQPFAQFSYYFLVMLTLEAKKFGNVLFTGDGADEVFFGYRKFNEWVGCKTNARYNSDSLSAGFPLSDYGYKQRITDMIGHGMVKVDKATAEYGMEARCPFLDKELVDYVSTLPQSFWMAHRDEIKYPLKKILLRKGLNDKFVNRRKLGFSYPFRIMLLPKFNAIAEYINNGIPRLEPLGIVLSKKVSIKDMFNNLTYYWRVYILLRYIDEHNGEYGLILRISK